MIRIIYIISIFLTVTSFNTNSYIKKQLLPDYEIPKWVYDDVFEYNKKYNYDNLKKIDKIKYKKFRK